MCGLAAAGGAAFCWAVYVMGRYAVGELPAEQARGGPAPDGRGFTGACLVMLVAVALATLSLKMTTVVDRHGIQARSPLRWRFAAWHEILAIELERGRWWRAGSRAQLWVTCRDGRRIRLPGPTAYSTRNDRLQAARVAVHQRWAESLRRYPDDAGVWAEGRVRLPPLVRLMFLAGAALWGIAAVVAPNPVIGACLGAGAVFAGGSAMLPPEWIAARLMSPRGRRQRPGMLAANVMISTGLTAVQWAAGNLTLALVVVGVLYTNIATLLTPPVFWRRVPSAGGR
ncbi:PH domain-containing protein [Streptomyces boninensis]|uniref:PH domain-containing protein n=1 Tax=Streptomyces boninensis TaxID=2039455 RepID=UPI003B21264C